MKAMLWEKMAKLDIQYHFSAHSLKNFHTYFCKTSLFTNGIIATRYSKKHSHIINNVAQKKQMNKL